MQKDVISGEVLAYLEFSMKIYICFSTNTMVSELSNAMSLEVLCHVVQSAVKVKSKSAILIQNVWLLWKKDHIHVLDIICACHHAQYTGVAMCFTSVNCVHEVMSCCTL